MLPWPTRVHNSNGISIGSAMFYMCPYYTLQWAALSPSELSFPMGGCQPPSNMWFFGPTQFLISMTDRPTERQTSCYSVSNNRLYLLHSTAVRPNNTCIIVWVRYSWAVVATTLTAKWYCSVCALVFHRCRLSDFLVDCAERIIIMKIVYRRLMNRYR